MTTCTQCSASVPPGRFCASCGALLPTLQPATQTVEVPQQPAYSPAMAGGAPTAYAPSPPPPPYAPPSPSYAPPVPSPSPSYAPAPTVLPAAQLHPQLQPLSYAGAVPRRRSDPRTTGTAVVTVGALLVAAFFLFAHPATHHITGQLTLSDSAFSDLTAGDSCTGRSGYDDISGGASVVVEDGAGATLATTTLDEGQYDGDACVFSFDLPHVPKKPFYSIKLGNSHRGEQRYSYDEMVSHHWAADLTLGA